MIDKDITEHFFILSGGAERDGKGFACEVTVVRTATNEPEAVYRAEGDTAQRAESAARAKAEQAINDAYSHEGEPRLAAEPRPYWRRPVQPQPVTFSFRAEGAAHVERFDEACKQLAFHTDFIVHVDRKRSDVDVELQSSASLEQLRDALRTLPDSDVMLQTLRECRLADNTLERDYGLH